MNRLLMQILLPKFKQPSGIKGEANICLSIASWLREKSLTDEAFPYIWFHIPNQYSGSYRGIYGALLAWMGKILGVPDYVFISKEHSFFVEVKTSIGKQSPSQKIFQKWCEEKGINYFICHSLEEFKNTLILAKKDEKII